MWKRGPAHAGDPDNQNYPEFSWNLPANLKQVVTGTRFFLHPCIKIPHSRAGASPSLGLFEVSNTHHTRKEDIRDFPQIFHLRDTYRYRADLQFLQPPPKGCQLQSHVLLSVPLLRVSLCK